MGSGTICSEENMVPIKRKTITQTNPVAGRLETTEEVPFEVGIINVDSDNSSDNKDYKEFPKIIKGATLGASLST